MKDYKFNVINPDQPTTIPISEWDKIEKDVEYGRCTASYIDKYGQDIVVLSRHYRNDSYFYVNDDDHEDSVSYYIPPETILTLEWDDPRRFMNDTDYVREQAAMLFPDKDLTKLPIRTIIDMMVEEIRKLSL